MLSTDSQDKRVALFRAVKDQAVVEVYQAAAESEFGSQEFDIDQSVCRDKRIATQDLIQYFYLQGEHEKFASFCCEEESHVRRVCCRSSSLDVILIDLAEGTYLVRALQLLVKGPAVALELLTEVGHSIQVESQETAKSERFNPVDRVRSEFEFSAIFSMRSKVFMIKVENLFLKLNFDRESRRT